MVYKLKNVSYTYLKKFPALVEVNLEIHKGEQVAILGANGSGKSTLLKILNALIFPQKGEIFAFGKKLEPKLFETDFVKSFRSKVGFVFQDSDIQLFSPTVWDEIAFAPLQLSLPIEEVEERVRDVMEMLGIQKLKKRAPHTLSGGEKKKVAIASILSMNPEVLLLDEPTNNLDPRTKRWLIELLDELKSLGKTLVISTHDLDLALETTEKAVVFSEDHRVVRIASTHEVMQDRELLLNVNLIHEHTHIHGKLSHTHPHIVGKHH